MFSFQPYQFILTQNFHKACTHVRTKQSHCLPHHLIFFGSRVRLLKSQVSFVFYNNLEKEEFKLSVKIAPQKVTRSFSFNFRPFVIPKWPPCKLVGYDDIAAGIHSEPFSGNLFYVYTKLDHKCKPNTFVCVQNLFFSDTLQFIPGLLCNLTAVRISTTGIYTHK